MKNVNDVLERVADLCHRQWSGWMFYMFAQGKMNEEGEWVMPAEFVRRWNRQAKTSYENLSEAERDSDRKEAIKFLNEFYNG